MTPRPVETVLFDLDGTLLTYDQDPTAVLEATFEYAGVEPFCSVQAFWEGADEVPAVDSDHEFFTHLWRLTAERHGGPSDPDTHTALATGYERAVDHTSVSLRPDAREVLLEMGQRGKRVGLVTNGSRHTQTTKLDALSLHDHFETAVYAGEDTAPKPSAEPFELALDRLDARAETALYVGNSLEHDVVGAQNAGLRSAWYPGPLDPEDAGEHRPTYRLDSLADLVAFVE